MSQNFSLVTLPLGKTPKSEYLQLQQKISLWNALGHLPGLLVKPNIYNNLSMS